MALLVRDKTALPARSTVGRFFPLPELPYAGGTVAPDVCPLLLVAVPVPLSAQHGDAQNESTLATTRDGRAGVEQASP